jgi:Domain of unknown function (DUF4190)
METCGGCGATLSPQEQFCGACGRFRSDATTRVWPPQDATARQAWPPPQDAAPQGPPPGGAYGRAQATAPAYGGAPYGYTQPVPGYYYGPVAQTTTNVLAIISLVSGLLGIVLCFTGLVAIPTGHIALSQIKRSERATGPYVTRETGRGMAIAGLVLGYIWVALAVGYIVLIIAVSAGSSVD